ncbi:uncharacterized protein PG998_014742 [Apiospora kogelbergensis]|uniref:uncharacterized protein n=1 Tax=Apiospora kogelbergensis TaxID=1337665 RepID=UPI003131E443
MSPRFSNVPRRARQRKGVRRNARASNKARSAEGNDANSPITQQVDDDFNVPDHPQASGVSSDSTRRGPRGYQRNTRTVNRAVMSTTIPRPTDSRSGSICSLGSGTYSDDELEEDRAGSDSDLDRSAASLPDSGYASGEGDADERNLLQQFIDQCRIEGPTVANHDPKTTRVVDTENQKWQLFCKEMKDEEKAARLGCDLLLYEPKATLEACDAAIFKGYLHWRVKSSKGGIKKESSIMTYWNNLCMFYARETKRYMDGGILYDINNWVHAKLTPMFDLDTSKKEKAGLYVSDLDLILHHHWVTDEEVYAHERLRVQLAAILIIAGATSTRPEALIGNLRYRDVLFQLFPPGAGGKRSRLGLVVDFVNVKKTGGSRDPKKFGFHEEDTLLHDPVLHMLSLAFADDAFFNQFGFISLTKALKYKKVRDHLVRLGIALGYAKRLEFYDIRRGSGKKLHKALSPEERNKAMGHKLGDSSTYTRYYMTHFIDADTQAIVFGGDLQSDFVHLMGRLVRNSHAPTKLTDQQMYEVNKDHQLAKLRSERDGINNRIKAAPDAEIPELHSRRKVLQNEIDSLTKKLRHNRFQTAIREFHETFHSDEVARQLHGIRPSTLLAPPSIEYDLPERAEAARLFSLAAEVSNRDSLHQLRIRLINTLALLSKRRESPCRKAKSKSGDRKGAPKPPGNPMIPTPPGDMESSRIGTSPSHPATRSKLFCPFCKWADHEVGNAQRQKVWRIDSLARHIRRQHLAQQPESFDCPYDDCNAILGGQNISQLTWLADMALSFRRLSSCR